MTLIGFVIGVFLIVRLALKVINALNVIQIIMFWMEIPVSPLVPKVTNYLLIICIFMHFNFIENVINAK